MKTFKGEITALCGDFYMDVDGNKIPYELNQAENFMESGRCKNIEEMKNILKKYK
jgi:hypothetical protein